ncbi:MAG: putative serine/threonine-protein kinase Nek3 [Streblomastix strix]|uniref:non-specific serine/threonine protein kinase n=1 Tax=Streblomastix strix TaxID=222440 RepID=A0A5J4URN1_9EUKA|nr:MAG: putative serine/threonine-protein kinase Nek3 [Streblomastix strix]
MFEEHFGIVVLKIIDSAAVPILNPQDGMQEDKTTFMPKKSDYRVVRALGHGSFGSAFLITEIASGKQLVWKKMAIANKDDRRMALAEAEILRNGKSEFLVKYYGSFEDESEFYILMEYCDKGDLRQYINHLRELKAVASEDILLDIFAQLTEAINNLHSANIIHRDLKPENVFMTDNFFVKLGDLGMAKVIMSTQQHQTGIGGTIQYFPPELLFETGEGGITKTSQRPLGPKVQTKECDMFSLGVMIYELITLKHPFADQKGEVLRTNIIKCQPDPLPNYGSETMNQMKQIVMIHHVVQQLKYLFHIQRLREEY